ncbi:hypothetical protein CU102_26830 [Phyllobacterium brassicacearum]|uniref:Uncharacterized protein n=1 Tax=Phyllobacterium brassicacearum TaxID=314235 RepID=A0A2P7B5E3_9HYPH|nr:hypothetical protein CU102_26830 [Phyllobacterium brassicacearum]TDQ09127.1 hypothetical protein DEV91_1598 [Phyllobacterium brassicacearum]
MHAKDSAKKTVEPRKSIIANLGLFYVRIERSRVETDLIGPFKTRGEAEAAKNRHNKRKER